MNFPALHKRVILITGLGLLTLQLSGIGGGDEEASKDANVTINLENLASDEEPFDEIAKNSELVTPHPTPGPTPVTTADKVRQATA